jgi:mannose-6-phosphate isomerase-like protein (cupin superfamily)
MIIRNASLSPIDFDGLTIHDYTAGLEASSSLALVTVPPGAQHREAYSRRSDKYYFVSSGRVHFTLKDGEHILEKGDFCLIPRGEKYSYRNRSEIRAELVHIHTPSFSLEDEVFTESSNTQVDDPNRLGEERQG